MLLDFIVIFCLGCLLVTLFAGGKLASGSLFGSSSGNCACGYREPLEVKNREDETGRFYVAEATIDPQTGMCRGRLEDRKCYYNTHFVEAPSIEVFENKVLQTYEAMKDFAKPHDEYVAQTGRKNKKSRPHTKHRNKHAR